MTEKVAVVTGANKGIGYAIVEGLCKEYRGTVYLTSRDEKRGLKAVEKLSELGYKAIYHQLDITDQGSILLFCEHIRKTHGSIDMLINNAGVFFRKDTKEPFQHQVELTLKVNYYSLINFCTNIVPLVKDGGTIINISSSSGHLSRIPSDDLKQKFLNPNLTTSELTKLVNDYEESAKNGQHIEDGWGDSPYVVSKVAVNAYTFILQRENEQRNLKVNCVHPGYVATDMTANVGNKSPEQGAVAPLYLALRVGDDVKGGYFWHNCERVPWDGHDPRSFFDKVV